MTDPDKRVVDPRGDSPVGYGVDRDKQREDGGKNYDHVYQRAPIGDLRLLTPDLPHVLGEGLHHGREVSGQAPDHHLALAPDRASYRVGAAPHALDLRVDVRDHRFESSQALVQKHLDRCQR